MNSFASAVDNDDDDDDSQSEADTDSGNERIALLRRSARNEMLNIVNTGKVEEGLARLVREVSLRKIF